MKLKLKVISMLVMITLLSASFSFASEKQSESTHEYTMFVEYSYDNGEKLTISDKLTFNEFQQYKKNKTEFLNTYKNASEAVTFDSVTVEKYDTLNDGILNQLLLLQAHK